MRSYRKMKVILVALAFSGLLLGCGGNEVKGNQSKLAAGNPTSQRAFYLAQRGDHHQQHNLGMMYLFGREGLKKDPKKAAVWFSKAANAGMSKSQFVLGDLYVDGVGVEKDHKKAFDWYEKSAKQSEPGGMYSLGAMYANGMGVEKDYKKARYWFKQGVMKGNSRSNKALIELDEIEKKATAS